MLFEVPEPPDELPCFEEPEEDPDAEEEPELLDESELFFESLFESDFVDALAAVLSAFAASL